MGDLGVARILDPQFAVLDHRDVGRCAANVDGDHVFRLAGFAGPTPTNDAARWSGKQPAYRPPRGILDRGDTAVRLPASHFGRDAVFAKATFTPPDIHRA